MNIQAQLKDFDFSNTTIGVLGSHSALDVCLGAKLEELKTLVITQKGRNKVYDDYYKTEGNSGCVDDTIQLESFSDLLHQRTIEKLIGDHVIFIPHRSFEVYINDYEKIEKEFNVPMFGNRYLLKVEERGIKPNQYDLLELAKIRIPVQFKNPKDIDRLCLVKVLEKERGFERAFFVAQNYADYAEQVEIKLKNKVFTEDQLKHSIIEEYILGVHVNFNFFYSPLTEKLELLGCDTRRQTNIEGYTKLPAVYQKDVGNKIQIQYEEAGHMAVTVLESILTQIFEMGERFVKASKELVAPGVIGPFALQSIIVPGPPKKDIVVVDVSPRMPGSPGIMATPYSSYLYRKPISVGRRIAIEIKRAIKEGALDKIIT